MKILHTPEVQVKSKKSVSVVHNNENGSNLSNAHCARNECKSRRIGSNTMRRKKNTWQKFFTNRNESNGILQAGAVTLITEDTYTNHAITANAKQQCCSYRVLHNCYLASLQATITQCNNKTVMNNSKTYSTIQISFN